MAGGFLNLNAPNPGTGTANVGTAGTLNVSGGAAGGGGLPGLFSGDIGAAASDIFGGIGDLEAASSYNQAATYAGQNATLEKESTNIQQAQLQRHIESAVGGQVAQTAGAGLAMSGSALSAYKSSMQQGALAHGVTAVQGQININSYKEAQAQYQGMANASTAAGIGGIVGGIFNL